jgi:gamma-glutamyl-gamma-aminobutyrate hydrolase PuuD
VDDRPLIGITTSATTIPIAGEPLEIGYAPRVYDEAILAAGGLPVHVPTLPGSASADLLARLDGIVLSGGGDVNPPAYGEANTHAHHLEPDRDAAERGIVLTALGDGVPLLGVCRGAQILNVALGGTLVQDLAGHHFQHVPLPGPTHPVLLEPGSRLEAIYGTRHVDVNSIHHQAIARLGDGLAVTARSADGTVEAIELRDPGVWALAVQWHPEAMQAADAPQRRLFAALVAQARRQRVSQPPSTTSVEPVT